MKAQNLKTQAAPTAEAVAVDREKMNIVIVGHVDHGKSTVVGRLLADTGALPQGKLEAVKSLCERTAKPFEYAFLIDALQDERDQGITIDAARVFFKSAQRDYILLDAPGHVEFLRNMVTGAARAEAALLVIDAAEGVQENSRRHGYLLSLLGISQVAVLVNKMDLVGYQQAVFQAIQAEYSAFLDQFGVQPVAWLPISGREGDNLAQPSPNMPWYKPTGIGATVMGVLDAMHKIPQAHDLPFRMSVQDVYKFTRFGDDRRIVAGTVASGRLPLGAQVVFYPSGKRTRVASLEVFGAPAPQHIPAGRPAGFTMQEQIYVQRGELATLEGEPPPKVARRFRVSLFWLGKRPLVPKREYLLKLGSAKVKVQVESISRVMDASNLQSADKRQVDRNDVAELILSARKPLAFDLAREHKELGRFVLVDEYEIAGGGMILEDLPDAQKWVQDTVMHRNQHWETSSLGPEARAEVYNHRPALVLITGNEREPKKLVARALEAKLFHTGKKTYHLGIGNLVAGVDADLQGDSKVEARDEHLRRMGEVAHILLDAGIILIVTALDLTQSDLELIRTVVAGAQVEVIWVGRQHTTDLVADIHLDDNEAPAAAASEITALLQDHGILFKP